MAAPPGILIAAPRSGGGKTTLALGLMRAFRRRGLNVAAVKCGPDYIDPAFHAAATGKPSVNLDSWAMAPELLYAFAIDATRDSDLVVAEGVMGLFDGVPGPTGRSGCSADIAAALGWPVVLVVDVKGQSQSAAASALGFMSFDPRIRVAGVVLNRIASPRHEQLVRAGFEAAPIPVVGALPFAAALCLPERHLGLVQASETVALDTLLDKLADFVEINVDVGRILELAQPSNTGPAGTRAIKPPGQTIAVARDVSFSFIYPHLLRAWQQSGAEIRFFSPLADEAPPAWCDVCWLPGGYPELFAGQLAQASGFLRGVRQFSVNKPVYGECGGYMVLGKAMIDPKGESHAMLGLLDIVTSIQPPQRALGYREAKLLHDGILGPRTTRWRGHEFHYARITAEGDDPPFAEISDPSGSRTRPEGHCRGAVSGSFFHAIAPLV